MKRYDNFDEQYFPDDVAVLQPKRRKIAWKQGQRNNEQVLKGEGVEANSPVGSDSDDDGSDSDDDGNDSNSGSGSSSTSSSSTSSNSSSKSRKSGSKKPSDEACELQQSAGVVRSSGRREGMLVTKQRWHCFAWQEYARKSGGEGGVQLFCSSLLHNCDGPQCAKSLSHGRSGGPEHTLLILKA